MPHLFTPETLRLWSCNYSDLVSSQLYKQNWVPLLNLGFLYYTFKRHASIPN